MSARPEDAGGMEIRFTAEEDLPRIMEIYVRARAFMAAHGNPKQWGLTGWPPAELIREDIRNVREKIRVRRKNARVHAAFILFAEIITGMSVFYALFPTLAVIHTVRSQADYL